MVIVFFYYIIPPINKPKKNPAPKHANNKSKSIKVVNVCSPSSIWSNILTPYVIGLQNPHTNN